MCRGIFFAAAVALVAAAASPASASEADLFCYDAVTKTFKACSGAYPVPVTPSGVPAPLTPVATSQRITSLAAAASLTVPTGATLAVITADQGTANLRFRTDGTAPTASIGNELSSGATVIYSGNLATIQFIQEAATPTTPVLNISFFK